MAKNVTQYVQSRESQAVCFVKRGNFKTVHLDEAPAAPKFLHPNRMNAVALRAPCRRMQLDRNGHLRIVIVAAPAPVRRPQHGPQVLLRQRLRPVGGIAEPLKDRSRARHVARKREQIQIVLNARLWGRSPTCHFPHLMREPLEHHEVDPRDAKSVGGLNVCRAQTAPALGILDVASLNLLSEP